MNIGSDEIEIDLYNPYTGLTPRLQRLVNNEIVKMSPPEDKPYKGYEKSGLFGWRATIVDKTVSARWNAVSISSEDKFWVIKVEAKEEVPIHYPHRLNEVSIFRWSSAVKVSIDGGILPFFAVQAAGLGADIRPKSVCIDGSSWSKEVIPIVWWGVAEDQRDLMERFPHLCGSSSYVVPSP